MKRMKTITPWRKRMMGTEKTLISFTVAGHKAPDTFPKGKKMIPPKVKLTDYPYRVTTNITFNQTYTNRINPLIWLFERVGPHAYTDKNPRFFRNVPNVKITDGDSDWHVKVTPANKRRRRKSQKISYTSISSSVVTARWYFKSESQLALFLISNNMKVRK